MRMKIEGRGVIAIEWTRVLDYLSLAKPELTLLSVLTAVAGYCLGAGGSVHPGILLSVAAGTGMVGGGAGALNQYMERVQQNVGGSIFAADGATLYSTVTPCSPVV